MDWWASMSSASGANSGASNSMMADQMGQIDVNGLFDPWLNCDDLDLGTIIHHNNHITTTLPPEQTTTICGIEQQQASNVSSVAQQSHNQAALFSSSSSSSSSPTISSSNLHGTLVSSQADGTVANFSQGPAKSSMASDILNNLTSNKQSIFRMINSSHHNPTGISPASPQQHQSACEHPVDGRMNQQQQAPPRQLHCSSTSTAASPLSSVGSSPPNGHNNRAGSSYLQSPTNSISSSSPSAHNTTLGSPIKSSHHGSSIIQSNLKPTILQHINNQTANQGDGMHLSQSYIEYCPTSQNGNLQLYEQPQQFAAQIDSKSNLENLIHSGDNNQPTYHESPSAGTQSHVFMGATRQQQVTVGDGASLLNNNTQTVSGQPRQSAAKSRVAANTNRPGTTGKTNGQQNGGTTKQPQRPANQKGQKIRRCRHITDYVLADEEKRLLIKEGHTDFPMICQSRPLSKSEERILRKIRRKIRNKKSAQCSRQRKKEYVEELERKYAAVIRENEELKQIIDRIQEAQHGQTEQSNNGRQLHLHHHQHHEHQQQQQQQQQHQTVLSDPADLDWKDLFPNSIKIVQQSNVYD